MKQLQPVMRYAVLCLLLLGSSSASYADLLPGVWYEFGFDPNHSPLAAGCQPDDPGGVPCRPGIGSVNLGMPQWTFTSLAPVDFTITDGFLSGDSFDVLDFGVLVGSTPAVAFGHSCGLDPNICVVDSEISHNSFLLPAGDHSITVSVHAAQILGEGFVQFTPVPEPSTASLMICSVLFAIWRFHLMIPNAKIIDVRREPMACCLSNLKQLFAKGQEFTYSMEDIARYYRTYLALMRHWDAVLPGRILRVWYEDVAEDLEGNLRRILEFCGLEFEPACIEFYQTELSVRTASSEQVRQPIFRDGLFQWRTTSPGSARSRAVWAMP